MSSGLLAVFRVVTHEEQIEHAHGPEPVELAQLLEYATFERRFRAEPDCEYLNRSYFFHVHCSIAADVPASQRGR